LGIDKNNAEIMRDLSVSKVALVTSVLTTLPDKFLRQVFVSGEAESEK
jgi:hypothetical protein